MSEILPEEKQLASTLRTLCTDIRFLLPTGKVEANYEEWAKEAVRRGEMASWAMNWISSGYPEVLPWMKNTEVRK